jgi:hypothetical protein
MDSITSSFEAHERPLTSNRLELPETSQFATVGLRDITARHTALLSQALTTSLAQIFHCSLPGLPAAGKAGL